jgi:hypothetical protein
LCIAGADLYAVFAQAVPGCIGIAAFGNFQGARWFVVVCMNIVEWEYREGTLVVVAGMACTGWFGYRQGNCVDLWVNEADTNLGWKCKGVDGYMGL